MIRGVATTARATARNFSAAASAKQLDYGNTQFRENLRNLTDDTNLKRSDGSFLDTVVVEPRFTRMENSQALSTPFDAHSTIILLQDNLVVNDEIRYLGIKIAHSLGVRCVIPDLSGSSTGTMDYGGYMRAMEDVDVTRKFIGRQFGGSAGIIGLGHGGGVALASAAHVENLECAVSFYGLPPSSVVNLSILPIPAQAHFGGEGDQTDAEFARVAFESLGRKSRKESWWLTGHDVFTYEGASNGFMNELPESQAPGQEFSKDQSQLALSRVHEFLVLNKL